MWYMLSRVASRETPFTFDDIYTILHYCLHCAFTWRNIKLVHSQYRIAGNFRGRKLSRISRFCGNPRMFYPRNVSQPRAPQYNATRTVQIAKVFSAKSYFSLIRESFIPRKFPAIRYARSKQQDFKPSLPYRISKSLHFIHPPR